jgi:hypothetical protein
MGTPVEVDEDVAHLGKLAQKILRGKGRTTLLKTMVEEDPTLRFPEIEAEKNVQAATAPLLSKIEQLEKDRANDQAMKNLEARRAAVPHIKGDALKKLEQFMVDKGIADYEIADREMKRLDQVAAPRPTPGRFGRAEMPDKDNKELYKDPAAFRSKTLHSLIDDIAAGKAI